MTNEEAIEIIETAIKEVEWEYPMDYATALNLAINALEWTTHTCENCKYNETCKGVQIDNGNVIKFYGEDGYCAMWERDDTAKRIAELEERAFLIKVGSDFLSQKDWEMLDEIERRIEELKC